MMPEGESQSGAGQGSGEQQQGQQQGGGIDWASETPPDDFDTNRAWQTLRNMRNEERAARQRAAQREQELQQAQQRLSQYEQAQMSEQERAQQRLQQLEQELEQERQRSRQMGIQAAVTSEATSLRFRNPALASRLLDPSAVEYDDKGVPTNVKALLQALVEQDPYLVQPSGGGDAGAGRNGSGRKVTTMNDAIRRAAGRA